MIEKSRTLLKLNCVAALTAVSAIVAVSPTNAAELKVKDFVPSIFGSSKPETPPAAPVAKTAQAAPVAAIPGGDEVIARVEGKELRASEIKTYLDALSAADRAALAQNPAALSQFVRVILVNQLVLKQAVAKRWEQQPANAALLQRVRDSAITEAYLQSVSKPADNFPTDADIQKVYEANNASFAVPRMYHLAQIYVSSGKGDQASKDKGTQKVAEIASQLKQPNADFATIAKSKSDAVETGAHGGEIGWITEDQLRPEVKALVIALSKGGVTDQVQVDDGWQFIKVLDIKEARTQTVAEVRPVLAQKMREQQATANRRAYVGELLKQNTPVINELALSKVLGTPATGPTASSTQ